MNNNQSNQNQEFTTESAHIVVQRKPKCQFELTITPNASLREKAKASAIQFVTKGVRLPGFRKGKAPSSLVEKNYLKEIADESNNFLLTACLKEYQTLDAPKPLNEEKLKGRISNDKVIILFETAPFIPSVDPTLCNVKPVERPVVGEEQVEEMIRQALMFLAEWKDVTDRPIQEGDFLILDVDVLEPSLSSLFRDTRFEVTDKSMARWMKDLVLGKNKDDVVEGESIADEDATEEDKKMFPPKKVRITIKKVEAAKLPELNESTLKLLGVDSEETLKERIKNRLNLEADRTVEEKERAQVIDFLSSYAFDLPESWVLSELRFRLNHLNEDPSFMNHWRSLSDEEKKELLSFLSSQAEKSIRLHNLCHRFLKDHNISLDRKDIEQAVGEADTDPSLSEETLKAEATSRVLLSKVTDYIIKQARQEVNS